jgi:hypothetical protein
MSKKRIAERQATNQRIAEQDAANRCGFCRRGLVNGYLTQVGPDGVTSRYCDENCRLDHIEAVNWREGR